LPDNSTGYGLEDAVRSPIDSDGTEIDKSIDLLVHQRTEILNTKLQVFAAEIEERLRLRHKNLDVLVREELEAGTLLMEFDPHYGTGRYDSRLHQFFYQKRFDLTKEQRQQDVECWRDIVLVMRDFLTAWEAHEQARARAIFLDK